MKIKKGSAIIYVLALMLVTAGYWTYISNESNSLETVSVANNQNETEEQLGDATLVNSNEVKENTENQNNDNTSETIENNTKNETDNYYQESKLSRNTIYSETLETYQSMLNNTNVSEEQKAIVTQEITKLNQEKNAIMICENLLSTKGFDKNVIFVNGDSISVIIGKEELKSDEIAQIQNIISREMSAKIENIHIMTKNINF